MAIHSSILAWEIPWTEKPGEPQSMGLQRIRHAWACTHCIFNNINYIIYLDRIIALYLPLKYFSFSISPSKEHSNTLATSCEELTHWKRLWCWEGLGAGGEGDHRGWDGWMASPTRWTWVWVNSGSWCWTGRPGVPQFMGSQRVRHNWATELNSKIKNIVWITHTVWKL